MAGVKAAENKTLAEIESLKDRYGLQCKIIKDVGEFAFLVSIKFTNMDFTLKFQIDRDYPTTSAEVLIRSTKMSESVQNEMLNCINRAEHSLMETVEAAMTWIQENNLDLTETPRTPSPKQKKPTHNKQKVEVEYVEFPKGPSMKTAEDVIHRIIWDAELSSDDFHIGYIDRFVGVVEKPFFLFSWEDLASLDYDVFAIPKHRIQYFKYKNRIVWDKTSKIDDIFGSTGSEHNLLDIIKEVDEEEKEKDKKKPQLLLDSDDSDSDDDIEINLCCTTARDFPNDGEDKLLYPREKYWGKKIRPTHFLALRITNQELLDNIEEVQKLILGVMPEYGQCMIPVFRQHLTFVCLGLDSAEQIQKAVETLQGMKNELDAQRKNVQVTFSKLSQFVNKTLYACVEENKALLIFINHLKVSLAEAGIEIRDVFDFVPHTTIVKLSMQFGREHNTRYLDPRVLKTFGDTYFGTQVLDNIYLCEMSDSRNSDGFYVCPTSIKFN